MDERGSVQPTRKEREMALRGALRFVEVYRPLLTPAQAQGMETDIRDAHAEGLALDALKTPHASRLGRFGQVFRRGR